jgi:hypothetical protein
MNLGFAFCVGEGLETKGETQGQRPNALPASQQGLQHHITQCKGE